VLVFLALPITNLGSNLDSFSNLKGILVNVKKGLPPFFFIPVYRTVNVKGQINYRKTI
jgi:hypothetical protein